uniref:Thioredoxin domain-containing protein n=1 Tax=Sparus aurata TaxID=8175 RepID=A0A671UN31_SPAAU
LPDQKGWTSIELVLVPDWSVVVAESFDNVVNDPGKDVLIQFYSLSCPHCKKLEPVYRELADKRHQQPTKVIHRDITWCPLVT